MKLSEDREVVDALRRILEDYDGLKYDEVKCIRLFRPKFSKVKRKFGVEIPAAITFAS